LFRRESKISHKWCEDLADVIQANVGDIDVLQPRANGREASNLGKGIVAYDEIEPNEADE